MKRYLRLMNGTAIAGSGLVTWLMNGLAVSAMNSLGGVQDGWTMKR